MRESNVKRPLCSLHPLVDVVLCPHDLYRYCQSDLELSDTFSPLANTDSQPHNLPTRPSTPRPCHTARTPPKHLLRRFFLIRRISPFSNSPLPPQHSTPMFPPACLPHHILQTWADWSAGRLEEVGRQWVGKVVGGCMWQQEQDVFLWGLVEGSWSWQMLLRMRR